MSENLRDEHAVDNKLIIYQLIVRLFGNKQTANTYYGSKEENGVGKFDDINDNALVALCALGISHIWYTGVPEHATMTDHSAYGIPPDDPDVVKGRAGSPYAIKDYYDVCPDLANNPFNRMAEFESLVKRTHKHGMKVIIDFVPNHVARTYKSDAKPAGVSDLGEGDDVSKAFDPQNNFYYLPGQSLKVPAGYNPGGDNFKPPLKDGRFDEYSAKATGNDVFAADPSINDWFETVKLNYGVDYLNNRSEHFRPIPRTWVQMTNILLFWAAKGIDGFRCDMCEMVPVQFWAYAIAEVKKVRPDIIFIGEAYNPGVYKMYIEWGGFDFLYDKVGLYDSLKRIIRQEDSCESISHVRKHEIDGLSSHMLSFLENHDEQRITHEDFAGDARKGLPMMLVSAAISTGPVMIYSGQELGEEGSLAAGFAGGNGRTTIFDYWSMPAQQAWMNGGQFDGLGLTTEQSELRKSYARLLTVCAKHEAIRKGAFYELQTANKDGKSAGYNAYLNYAFVRFIGQKRVLILSTFDADQDMHARLKLDADTFHYLNIGLHNIYIFSDLLDSGYREHIVGKELFDNDPQVGLAVQLKRMSGMILTITEVKPVENETELADAKQVRRKVFVEGQGVPSELEPEGDDEANHYVVYMDGKPLGAARWRETENGYKLERIAVVKGARGKGVGAALVQKLLLDIPRDGKKIYLNAQIDTCGFYSRFGFHSEGEVYLEAGIEHQQMILSYQ